MSMKRIIIAASFICIASSASYAGNSDEQTMQEEVAQLKKDVTELKKVNNEFLFRIRRLETNKQNISDPISDEKLKAAIKEYDELRKDLECMWKHD